LIGGSNDISWQERLPQAHTQHPEYSRCAAAVEKLKGTRRERAQQFFNGCLVEKLVLREPATLEKEIESCMERIRSIGSPSSWWKLDAWNHRF
jgi:hypothetical protein